MARHDWRQIRAEYVEGTLADDGTVTWPSLDELGIKHGIQPSRVRAHSADDGWVEQRALYQRRIDAQRSIERSTRIAEMGSDLDLQAVRIARSGLAVTAARLNELGTTATKRATALAIHERDPASTVVIPLGPDSEEVARLARAAGDWYDLGTKAMGDTPQLGVTIDAAIAVSVETDAERDARTEGIIDILSSAGVLRDHDDPDARGARLALTTGDDGAGAAADVHDAQGHAVHPRVADAG